MWRASRLMSRRRTCTWNTRGMLSPRRPSCRGLTATTVACPLCQHEAARRRARNPLGIVGAAYHTGVMGRGAARADLVGRDRELAALTAGLSRAADGYPGAAFVSGES